MTDDLSWLDPIVRREPHAICERDGCDDRRRHLVDRIDYLVAEEFCVNQIAAEVCLPVAKVRDILEARALAT